MWQPLETRNAIALLALAALLLVGGCTNGENFSVGSMVEDILPPTPGETAREAFNVYDPDQRRKSIIRLSNAPWGGEPPYLKTYRLLVDDPDPTVRAACIAALGRHGYADDVNAIVPYLQDRTYFVRWESAKALQRLQNEVAIEPLIVALREDDEPDVRTAAAKALGQYDKPAVFQALVGALNDDDYAVVRQSQESLKLLTGEDFGEDGAAWLAWSEDRGETLFASAGTYTYDTYVAPPTLTRRLQFWRDSPEQVGPREPQVEFQPVATVERTEPVLPPLPPSSSDAPANTTPPPATTTQPANTTQPATTTQPAPTPRPATTTQPQPRPQPTPQPQPQPQPQPRPATTPRPAPTPTPRPTPVRTSTDTPQPRPVLTQPQLIRRPSTTTTADGEEVRRVIVPGAQRTSGPVHPLGATDGRRPVPGKSKSDDKDDKKDKDSKDEDGKADDAKTEESDQ